MSQAAHDYVQSQKEDVGTVTQEFAEILFTGDIWKGYGPGAFSMAGGLTYREQSFWQLGLPREIEYYGPPLNAPQLGIRGFPAASRAAARICTSSRRSRRSRANTTSGRRSRSSICRCGQSESGNQRFELDVAARHSDYSTSGGIVSHKTGINFQVAEAWRLRATVSRDVREPTFAERFNLQGGGGQGHRPAVAVGSPADADHGDERRQPGPRSRGSRHDDGGLRLSAARHRSAAVGRLVRHRSQRTRSARWARRTS